MSRLCVGIIVGAHGVRGELRIKSFTEDPADLASYGPVEDEAASRKFRLTLVGEAKGVVIARLAGVSDRNAAEALKGVKLFIARSALPELEEEEFYYSDLVGLRAEGTNGDTLGTVKGVFNFGGGDVIELVAPDGSHKMFAFTLATVPVVDVKGGRLVIDPPEETEARPDGEEEDAGKDGE